MDCDCGMHLVYPNDPNGKALFYMALKYHNWNQLYTCHSGEDMTTYFYATLTAYIVFFLPMVQQIRYSTEKPWVNNHYRQLIKKDKKPTWPVIKVHLRNSVTRPRGWPANYELSFTLGRSSSCMKQINIPCGNMFETSLILSYILHYLPLKYRTINYFPMSLTNSSLVSLRISTQSSQTFYLHYLTITVASI